MIKVTNLQEMNRIENGSLQMHIQKKAEAMMRDSPRGGEMPAGQRGPLSTRGTAVRRWRGSFVESFA